MVGSIVGMSPRGGYGMTEYRESFVDFQTFQKVTLMNGITTAQRRKMVSIGRKIQSVLTGGCGGLPKDWVTVCYEGGFVLGIDPEGRGSS